jgi:alanine racemase
LKKNAAFYRPTWVEIDHSALAHNYRTLSRLLPRSAQILAVVKANAYGHGLIPVSRTVSACGARFLGITSLEEALALKEAGIRTPPLILGNIFPFENLIPAIRNEVRVTVASPESARMCDRYARRLGKKVFAHAKIDTGMGRIGVSVRNAVAFVRGIRALPSVRLEGIYTHFSDSAEDPAFTRRQIRLFSEIVSALKASGISIPFVHCDNSAGLLKYPESRFTLVRPGLSLYGVWPAEFPGAPQLKPVLSWKSRIVFLKDVPPQTPISYARTFTTRRRSRIATAAFGYADGFRRSLSNHSEVLVRGRRVRQVGRVTMDMTMLDVTGVPKVSIGDEVVLLGRQGAESIPVQELAGWLGTSPYETLCGISTRVPRVDLGAKK